MQTLDLVWELDVRRPLRLKTALKIWTNGQDIPQKSMRENIATSGIILMVRKSIHSSLKMEGETHHIDKSGLSSFTHRGAFVQPKSLQRGSFTFRVDPFIAWHLEIRPSINSPTNTGKAKLPYCVRQ